MKYPSDKNTWTDSFHSFWVIVHYFKRCPFIFRFLFFLRFTHKFIRPVKLNGSTIPHKNHKMFSHKNKHNIFVSISLCLDFFFIIFHFHFYFSFSVSVLSRKILLCWESKVIKFNMIIITPCRCRILLYTMETTYNSETK